MRKHIGIGRRMLAVGLAGDRSACSTGARNVRSGERAAARDVSDVAAAAIETPRKLLPKKDDAAAPREAGHVELSTEMCSVRCKAATALVELRSIGSGSAVCVSVDGLFVTNHHVVASAGLGQNVRLVVHPGQKTQRVLDARVIKLDDENDLALLEGRRAARPGGGSAGDG